MQHEVVSENEWIAKRAAFLKEEKEFNKIRDGLAAKRRALPWMEVKKGYTFEGPDGKASLSELFGNKSQLIVYHLMFAPEWKGACTNCSFWADHFDSARLHLGARDTNLVAISRAPVEKIEAWKKKQGWNFPWYSSDGNSFPYDFHASFTDEQVESKAGFYNFQEGDPYETDREGISVFYKDPSGKIYLTYQTFARGIDLMNTTYNFLDLTPKGRDEEKGHPMEWLKLHGDYSAEEKTPS